MRIVDYENCRHLNDIGISLTWEEADELRAYLDRLCREPSVGHVHLSEFTNARLEREVSFTVVQVGQA